MSANALAMALHVPAPRINDIIRERRAITPDTALRLARYFDTTAQFWLNLQSAFDLKIAESEKSGCIALEVRPRAMEKAA
jgi:addiction module HigA family antidote